MATRRRAAADCFYWPLGGANLPNATRAPTVHKTSLVQWALNSNTYICKSYKKIISENKIETLLVKNVVNKLKMMDGFIITM